MITYRVSAGAARVFSPRRGIEPSTLARMIAVSWVFVGLLAGAVVVLIAAEWPRMSVRLGSRSA